MPLKVKITQGFTMIELLVVMSIVAVLMALVGPMALNSIDKTEGKIEKITLENWLSKVSVKAFTTGNPYYIDLSAKKITLYQLSSESLLGLPEEPAFDTTVLTSKISTMNNAQLISISIKTFKYLSFPKQEFVFNNRGFITPHLLRYQYNNETYTVELSTLINGETDDLIDNRQGGLEKTTSVEYKYE